MNTPEYPLDVRWKQRFSNFERAFILLREAIELDPNSLSQLEKEGIIQRFEYTFELAWKTLKDKMQHDGVVLEQISPKAVVRQAFSAKYLDTPEIWLKMIGDRNLMSHTYNFAQLEGLIEPIRSHYLSTLQKCHNDLLAAANKS